MPNKRLINETESDFNKIQSTYESVLGDTVVIVMMVLLCVIILAIGLHIYSRQKDTKRIFYEEMIEILEEMQKNPN